MPSARVPLALWIAFAACLALLAIQLGWLPPLRYQWGFVLWQYLPRPAVFVLAAGVLLLGVPAVRAGIARGVRALASHTPRGAALALLAATPVALFLLRERQLVADSLLVGMFVAKGWTIWAPELGSFFLLWLASKPADWIVCGAASGHCFEASAAGLTSAFMQGLVCVFGALAVLFIVRLAFYLAPTSGRRAFVAAFVLCGGLLRVCAGHLEVYAFVLAAASAYLWAACALIRGRCRPWVPAAVLGVGVWIHFSLALLFPTLLHAIWLAEPSEKRRRWPGRALGAAALVAAPTAAFLLAFQVAGLEEDLARVWTKTREILGLDRHPAVGGLWLGGAASHAKFLANSFFVLAPAALPVVLGTALVSVRRLVATPTTAFLAGACAWTFAYALLLRPVWGPYDWDLFSLTALCFAVLGGHLLATTLDAERLEQLGTLLIGASLLFVAVPFLWVGVAPSRDGGPFRAGEQERQIGALREKGGTAELFRDLEERLGPWR